MPGFPIITTTGDLLIGGIAGIETRLPGNTTEDRQFLVSVGDGDDAAAPEWTTVAITDVDGLSTALSGKASTTHTHAISDVTNLQTALDAKAALTGATFTGNVSLENSSPVFRLAPDGSSTTYTRISDDGTAIHYDKYRQSGEAAVYITPRPSDGTSSAQFRMFRATNTTGYSYVDVCQANGTNSINTRLGANGLSFVNAIVGNVGIGTNSPSTKFHVVGISRFDGAIQPASLADSSAPNNSIYFSTDASKLAYKDSGGSVHELY